MDQGELEDYVQKELTGEPAFGEIQSVSCDGGLAEKVGDRADCVVSGSVVTDAPVRAAVGSIEHGRLVVALDFLRLAFKQGRL